MAKIRGSQNTPANKPAIVGFDPDTGKYVQPSGANWSKREGLKEQGRKDGRANLPKADDDQLNEVGQKIRLWTRDQALKCQANVDTYIGSQHNELDRIEGEFKGEVKTNEVEQIRQSTETRIKSTADQHRLRLQDLTEKVLTGHKNYQDFKAQAGLSRNAEYEPNVVKGWCLIILIGIVEVIANAMLLKDVTESGLVGATMTMLLISGVNIFFGVVLGMLFREGNHIAAFHKLLAWTGASLVIAGIVIWNLCVGHLRDSLLGQSLNEVEWSATVDYYREALDRMQGNPVGLDSFQSWILVCVGLICFGFAAWKRYQQDDPYPGYGRLDRAQHRLQKRYMDELDKARTALEDAQSQGVKEIRDIQSEMKQNEEQWNGTKDRIDDVVKNYKGNLKQYDILMAWLFAQYMDANKAARSEPAPSWFSEERSILDEDLSRLKSVKERTLPDRGSLPDTIHAAITEIQKAYRWEVDQWPSLEGLQAQFKKLEYDEDDMEITA